MSNLIPLRRTTRATRNLTKDNENANARPSRILARAKTHGTAATDGPHAPSTVPTLGKVPVGNGVTGIPVGKRKREVLVEVTGVSNNNRKARDGGPGKGKEKEKDMKTTAEDIPTKPTVATRPTRESLRDHEAAKPQRHARNTSIASVNTQGAEPAANTGVRDFGKVTTRVARPNPSAALTRKTSVKFADDPEVERVFKKRHTEQPIANGTDESLIDVESIPVDLADVEPEPEEKAAREETPKVEEKPQLWDDLDANDWDDPVMVSEYVAEVCVYLKEIEQSMCPKADYMSKQPEIDWEKRGILVDWILQVHARFNLLQETLFLFTNILDRFLASRPVSLAKFQLVGITAFFIAAKYEETYAPSVSEIARLADNMYSIEDILKAERYILRTLEWDLRYSGPLGWLRRGSKADNCDVKARTVGKYLMEIGCLDCRLVSTSPSLLAAAAMWLARLILGREVWTPNMEHYMTYSEAEVLPTANVMLNYVLDPVQHESLFKKYSHKKYLKCSAFMRHWALERWSEGTTVDLEAELSGLKKEIRLEREKVNRRGDVAEGRG